MTSLVNDYFNITGEENQLPPLPEEIIIDDLLQTTSSK